VSKTRFDIQTSAAQNASANGGPISVSGIKALGICIDVTACSGSLSSVYLQSSSDGGTSWFDLLADTYVYTTSGTTITSGTSSRNPVFSISTGVIVKCYATYSKFGDYIRAAWVIAGSGPTSTFSVKAIGEN
jgi:hypothetical protein